MNPLDWFDGLLLLAAAASDAHGSTTHEHAGPGVGELFAPLLYAVVVGMVVTGGGMLLCLYRLMRGPSLADRVIAADLFALHVVAAVVLLTIYLGYDVYFGSVLGIAIIGFASTVAFAQLIGATGKNADRPTVEFGRAGKGPLSRGDRPAPHTINRCPETGELLEDPPSLPATPSAGAARP